MGSGSEDQCLSLHWSSPSFHEWELLSSHLHRAVVAQLGSGVLTFRVLQLPQGFYHGASSYLLFLL